MDALGLSIAICIGDSSSTHFNLGKAQTPHFICMRAPPTVHAVLPANYREQTHDLP